MLKKRFWILLRKWKLFFEFFEKVSELFGPKIITRPYVNGYLSRFWADFDLKIKFIQPLKLQVLSNLTVSFKLPHKKLQCAAPSLSKLNYPFKSPGEFLKTQFPQHLFTFDYHVFLCCRGNILPLIMLYTKPTTLIQMRPTNIGHLCKGWVSIDVQANPMGAAINVKENWIAIKCDVKPELFFLLPYVLPCVWAQTRRAARANKKTLIRFGRVWPSISTRT